MLKQKQQQKLLLCYKTHSYNTLLKSTPNDRVFEKLFMEIVFILRVFARNLLRRNGRKSTFCILF